MRYYTVLLFLVSIFSSTKSYGIEPQHQVAHSYGGTRVYAHDSVIISPNAAINLYSQTTTGLSTDTTNAPRKDALCRSVVNTSDNDYFVPWRSALQSNASKNEWTRFIQAASTGTVPGLSVYSCCYPRINPNKPCNVVYPLGKRKAGALPSKTPAATDPSVEVENYAAQGDVSYDVVGFNRKESWVCDAGEWVYSSNEGGCFQDGKCNKYDAATNPSGFDGASINAIPSSTADRANFMCNGVSPVAFGTSTFPNPNNIATPPPYGTAGWTWKCPGQSGGTSEFCQASYNGNPMKGVCGYAQGRTVCSRSHIQCSLLHRDSNGSQRPHHPS